MSNDLMLLVTSLIVVFLAYLVRGMAGFGSGLIAIPLLSLWMPVTQAVPLIVSLDLLASAGQSGFNFKKIHWKEVWFLLPFSLVGVTGGLWLFTQMNADALKYTLGIFLLVYGIYSQWTPAMPPISRAWVFPAGFAAGLIGTLFGTGGPFYAAYLKARQLDKQIFRATFACIFLLDAPVRLVGYVGTGLISTEGVHLFAMMLPVMILGMYFGGSIHTKISTKYFNRGISLLLIGSGIALIM